MKLSHSNPLSSIFLLGVCIVRRKAFFSSQRVTPIQSPSPYSFHVFVVLFLHIIKHLCASSLVLFITTFSHLISFHHKAKGTIAVVPTNLKTKKFLSSLMFSFSIQKFYLVVTKPPKEVERLWGFPFLTYITMFTLVMCSLDVHYTYIIFLVLFEAI